MSRRKIIVEYEDRIAPDLFASTTSQSPSKLFSPAPRTCSEAVRFIPHIDAARSSLSSLSFIVTMGSISGSLSQFVSYDFLVYTRLNNARTASNLPRDASSAQYSSGGTNVTGLSRSPGARLGGTACENTAWASGSALLCRAVRGHAATIRMSVTAGLLTCTVSEAASYDNPLAQLGSSEEISAAYNTQGGVSRTVIVKLDLVVQSLATRVGGTASEASEWVSSSSMRCKFVVGMLASMKHVLTSGARLQSSNTQVTTYELPVISKLESGINFLSTNAQMLATVSGSQFTRIDSTEKLRLTSTSAEASFWLSATTVATRQATGSGSSQAVIITEGIRPSSLTTSISFNAAFLSGTMTSNVVVAQDGRISSVIGAAFGASASSTSGRLTIHGRAL